MAHAVIDGITETAIPLLLAMLCILSVFIPAFIMAEPVRSLFVPLSLAAGFAMIASYVLANTLVPVLSVWLVKHRGQKQSRFFEHIRLILGRLVGLLVTWRWVAVTAYAAACGLVFWLVGMQLGTELFPQIDAGTFVFAFARRRAPITN